MVRALVTGSRRRDAELGEERLGLGRRGVKERLIRESGSGVFGSTICDGLSVVVRGVFGGIVVAGDGEGEEK